jgi:histidyl-tRNA synthetase
MSISTKPPSGFRDFLPRDARRRERVFHVIREVYEAHGFEPLGTPCFERLSTLTGKYGEEGDQLIFKVLKRGNKLDKALRKDAPTDADLSDAGLRYDLTVPLARVYAEHRNELPGVFKRYQIAPVWRADRPQRGRFREFFQCDVDVVGSTSMTVEAEVASALASVLDRLGFGGVRVHINHRGLLRAIIQAAGIPLDQETDALIAIDKLDKIGLDGVRGELEERGIPADGIAALLDTLGIQTTGERGAYTNGATLEALEARVGELDEGKRALGELRQVLDYASGGPAGPLLFLDPFLARGLSYYTGPIFEIRSDDFSGSLGGGGRYDGLIGMFGKQSVPACGFSLGVERILVLMEERGMFGEEAASVDLVVALIKDETVGASLALAQDLRREGVRVDVYPDSGDKLGKQLKYADERGAPYVAILGPDELAAGVVAVKDLRSGEQVEIARGEVAGHVKG